jgi:putative nucleotidyltransferase with HDIG domain
VDDDQGIIDTLKVILERSGYQIEGETDPIRAVELVRNNKYDMMLLDFIMTPIHGNEVVERIRRFNKDIYILLLTGHKDLAPPLDTIRQLDIQGYCEKSDRFDQLLLLVESGIKSIMQMKTISEYKDGLNNILHTLPGIYQLDQLKDMPLKILENLAGISGSQNIFILLDNAEGYFNAGKDPLYIGMGKFSAANQSPEDYKNLTEQIAACRMENTAVVSNELMILPLTDNFNNSSGVLGVQLTFSKTNEMVHKLVEIYSKQASSALNNAMLHGIVNKTYETLRLSFLDTIEALRIAVDVKDIYTRGHSDRVAYYSQKLGEALALEKEEIEILRIAGIFHDIGKIGISDQILFKDDELTNCEYDEIRLHPQKGANILSAITVFKDVAPIVLAHHERVDGSGYPNGLKGDEIPYLARVISITDAFDAMMSDRHYRDKLTLEESRHQLLNGRSRQFDAEVVNAFIKLLDEYPEMVNNMDWTF